jgi:TonB family protein
VIFFEIFAAFNWFNPIAFLYKRAIKDIHEFIADETAALTLENKSAYTLLLVSNVFGAKPQHLTNSFFNQSLLKRRIIMLHKTKSRKVAILKYGLSVPLFALMIIISSATIGKSQQVVDVTEALKAKVSLILSAKPAITVASDLKETSSKDDKQIPAAAKLDDTPPLDYKKVDEIAEFPGGVQGLYEWFKAGFIYPQAATDQGMDEHMIAGFIIEKDGSLSNIKIVKGAGFGTPEIAVKLLEKSPKWAPVNLKVPEMHTEASWILKENALPQTGRDTVIAYFANDRTYLKMPSNATYPGGVPAFNKYLSENLKFPEEATENKVTGIVSLSFTVNKDGTIENIAVSRGIGHGCDEEAIRLIKDSGKWEPGKYEDGTLERTGKAVEIIFLSKDSKK